MSVVKIKLCLRLLYFQVWIQRPRSDKVQSLVSWHNLTFFEAFFVPEWYILCTFTIMSNMVSDTYTFTRRCAIWCCMLTKTNRFPAGPQSPLMLRALDHLWTFSPWYCQTYYVFFLYLYVVLPLANVRLVRRLAWLTSLVLGASRSLSFQSHRWRGHSQGFPFLVLRRSFSKSQTV